MGTLKPFNPRVDDWEIYAERLRHYLIGNGVTDEGTKRSILLSQCGTPTFKLLRSLVGKEALETMSFADLVKVLTTHHNPPPSSIVQRFHFNSRVRAEGESIAQYVAALRDLALHCEYGDKLSEMLRDRLVCGVNHKGIQRKLLAQTDLTYDKAYALALSVEASDRDMNTLGQRQGSTTGSTATAGASTADSTVPPAPEISDDKELYYSSNGSSRAGSGKGPISCYSCGGAHLAPQCRHKNVVCHKCKKKGHFA